MTYCIITDEREWTVTARSTCEAIQLAFQHRQAETPFLVACEASLRAAYRKFWSGWGQIQQDGQVIIDTRERPRW